MPRKSKSLSKVSKNTKNLLLLPKAKEKANTATVSPIIHANQNNLINLTLYRIKRSLQLQGFALIDDEKGQTRIVVRNNTQT